MGCLRSLFLFQPSAEQNWNVAGTKNSFPSEKHLFESFTKKMLSFLHLFLLSLPLCLFADDFVKLQNIHRAQVRTFFSFLRSGICKHLYFDMGTNIGMQMRKLYEPQLFPNARSLPYFASTFGTGDRRDVCALGFEPNSRHAERLIAMQSAYQKANFPLVIFTNTAVSTYDGQVVFYRAPQQNNHYHESGASTIVWSGTTKETNETAIAVDIDHLFHNILKTWRGHTDASLVVAKLDIEGGEYTVLPHMLSHGSLCKVDQMLIEWHERFFPKPGDNVLFAEKMILMATNGTARCNFKKVDLDDNDYADGTDRRPFPPPAEIGHFNNLHKDTALA